MEKSSFFSMSSFKKLRGHPTTSVQDAPLLPSIFVQKTWVRAESTPNFPSADLTQAEANTGLSKVLVPRI